MRSRLFHASDGGSQDGLNLSGADHLTGTAKIKAAVALAAANGKKVTVAEVKRLLEERVQKNLANKRLRDFQRLYTRVKTGAAPASHAEKLEAIPQRFDADDWQEPLLYAYFAINYYDHDMFREILMRANNFAVFPQLRNLLKASD